MRRRQSFGGSGFEVSERMYHHDLTILFPMAFAFNQSGFEHGLGSAKNRIQQSCGSGAIADCGEVNDDRDVLVSGAGIRLGRLTDAMDLDP